MSVNDSRRSLPVIISIEMEAAKVNSLQVQDSGEIFSRGAVIIEIPIISSGTIAEEAVSAKGDQMIRVD